MAHPEVAAVTEEHADEHMQVLAMDGHSHDLEGLETAAGSEEHAGALEAFRRCPSDLERNIFLRNLRDRNESFFFSLLISHAQEILPIVYTPTIGQVCQEYSKLPVRARGAYITPSDRGQVKQRLLSSPWTQGPAGVQVIVVTDGERILGLGDLGSGGMGISEGKILLYTVIAGVAPDVCLPCCLDVGTNNKALLEDPLYKGLRQERLTGAAYDELVEEFMDAVKELWPHCLVQFEDFGNHNAFRVLEKFKGRQLCFNDDIEGTSAIALAGLLSALRITGGKLEEERLLFLGAGEAGTGIGNLIARAMQVASQGKLSAEQARQRCFFLDSRGLVCKSRTNLQAFKLPFAHDVPFQADLLSAVKAIRPTMLVGVSSQPGAFSKEVVEAMVEINDRPIIYPLSNPTSKSECTFQEAWEWSKGRVVFASGSPFPPLKAPNGDVLYPSQANNAYVFPSVGMAAVLCKCKSITEEVFMAAAQHLAALNPEENIKAGALFPTFSELKTLVVPLIACTAQSMVALGLGTPPEANMSDHDWEVLVAAAMYKP